MTRYGVLALAFAAFGCAAQRPAMHTMGFHGPALHVYPAPMGEKLSEGYDLAVNGQKVPVYVCRVSAMPFNRGWPGHQRSLDQTELAAFAYWDMAAPADVEIVSHRPIRAAQVNASGQVGAPAVAVRPTARGIVPTVRKNRISFRLDKPGPLTVEINGTHFALHLFPSPAKPATHEAMADAPVRYFGPGIHRPGKITLQSNQIVCIAGGAVVYGSIQAAGASNIKILGRGILDASRQERGRGKGGGCIRLTNCDNVEVDGVILRDPDVWCFTLQSCSKVSISNVKLIGLWRYNSDGIDVCNSQDVALRDCFVRSFDDSIVIKGLHGRGTSAEPKSVQRITAERCVLWNDWGRALEIGAETVAAKMTDITFRNCDVIHTDFAAMDIQHGDRAAIRNVLYENIRFEIDPVSYQGVFQRSEDQKYEPKPGWVPRLLVIEIVHNEWSRDNVQGTVDGVTLRNVTVTGPHFPSSRLQGFDANHQVKNVSIEGLRVDGRVIRHLSDARINIRPFVKGVRLNGLDEYDMNESGDIINGD